MSYFNLTSNRTCESCNPACKTCTGPSTKECYSCNSGYFNLNTSCVESSVCLAAGLYAEVSNNTCNKCHPK